MSAEPAAGSPTGALVGRRLATRYEIVRLIGRGGMCTVYRAVDHRLGREVALKVITPAPGAAPAALAERQTRLRREAASAARIPPHANVVQIYDFGTDSEAGVDFIAMELLRGRDLRAAMRDGIGEDTGRRILVEAARGLAAGHRAGVIHRDVKPANIFLVGADNIEVVKILDFGIARALHVEDDESGSGRIPHSPNYTSPEQLDTSRPLTPASDVYQLGLVGYELLAGARPFTPEERAAIRRGEHVPLPVRGQWASVEPEMRAAIERALAIDPAGRFADAAEFAAALSEAGIPTRSIFFGGVTDEPFVTAESAKRGQRRAPTAASVFHDIGFDPDGTEEAAAPVRTTSGGLILLIVAILFLALIIFFRNVEADQSLQLDVPSVGGHHPAQLPPVEQHLTHPAVDQLDQAFDIIGRITFD